MIPFKETCIYNMKDHQIVYKPPDTQGLPLKLYWVCAVCGQEGVKTIDSHPRAEKDYYELVNSWGETMRRRDGEL